MEKIDVGDDLCWCEDDQCPVRRMEWIAKAARAVVEAWDTESCDARVLVRAMDALRAAVEAADAD